MTKTKVFLLVPTYLGLTGTIQAAFKLASNVEVDGPIQFHLVDYPEENPKHYMIHDDDWDGVEDIRPSDIMTSASLIESITETYFSLQNARETRRWIETPSEVLERMAKAEDWFFSEFREDREHSLVILLNPYGNDHNYFCGPSPERSNVAFIQTTHYATETLTARHVPVAYELFASAMRFRAFNVPDYQDRFAHMKDRGCMNDFFSEIKNIRLKILSADICDDCYAHVAGQQINPLFIDHVFKGFETVRAQQNSFTRARRERRILGVSAGMKYLTFESIGSQVSLAPKEMSLYKFYMNHPDGVAYNEICDHREALFSLYEQHYQQVHSDDATVDQDRRKEAINTVLDRWCMQDDDLTQTVSKINRKIKQAVTDALAKPHQIIGNRGGVRKINALSL
tara:strand:+ start:1081 stop:2271 length:1191 start_codon:yes stop_codon:yes gene_type:complete